MLLLFFSSVNLGFCRAAFLDVFKYREELIPTEAWVEGNLTTFQALSTIDCASQAMGRGKFSYNFEPAQKICKVGIIDLAATATTSIKEHVRLQDFGQGAMILGNLYGDREVQIILPNGRICGRADHGVPDFEYEGLKMTSGSGVAEVDGLIYKCGGNNRPNPTKQVDSCFKIDISEESPTWSSIAPLPSDRPTPRGGLISYKDETQDINVLFQMPLNACPNIGDVYVYNIANDTWTSIPALISPKKSMAVASDHKRYIYLLGGTGCEGGYLAGIEIYDMAHPRNQGTRFPTALCKGISSMGCAVLQKSGENGIVCIGGMTGGRVKDVQFVPLTQDGSFVSGSCQQLTPLTYRMVSASLIGLANGRAIWYSGVYHNGGWIPNNLTMLWDHTKQVFEPSGFYTVSHPGHLGMGRVDAFSTLMKRCWKLL